MFRLLALIYHWDVWHRRICPGRYVAVQSMWAAMACILATLRITNAKDEHGNPIAVVPEFTTGVAMYVSHYHDIHSRLKLTMQDIQNHSHVLLRQGPPELNSWSKAETASDAKWKVIFFIMKHYSETVRLCCIAQISYIHYFPPHLPYALSTLALLSMSVFFSSSACHMIRLDYLVLFFCFSWVAVGDKHETLHGQVYTCLSFRVCSLGMSSSF